MDESQKTNAGRPECGCMGVGPQLTAMAQSIWSQATRDHFRNSRVEFLKGMRSMLDERIDRLSKRHQKGATVTVE